MMGLVVMTIGCNNLPEEYKDKATQVGATLLQNGLKIAAQELILKNPSLEGLFDGVEFADNKDDAISQINMLLTNATNTEEDLKNLKILYAKEIEEYIKQNETITAGKSQLTTLNEVAQALK